MAVASQKGRRGGQLPSAAEVDAGWGPTVRGRGRRRRPLRGLALVLLVVLVVVAAGLFWVSSRIPRMEVDGLAASSQPMHVLVVGSDSRDDLTPEERRALSAGGGNGERTDTIFVMTLQGGEVGLLAFPRDLWVERCDGTVGRINAAVQIDGPGCLVTTVRQLSGIDVQHYVRVTFGGFVDIVDAVGGVELCLDDAISDRDAGIDLPAGCQVLDGPDALGFVRVRKIDDDLHRIERQQQFLKALADEITSPSTLLNPVELWSLSNDVGGAISVNRGLGPVSMVRLGLGIRGLAAGAATTHTVPADPRVTGGGAAVLTVRQTEAEALFARFRDGSILDEVGTGDEPAVAPEDVRVTVLNGAGISGLAASVSDRLRAQGYQVLDVGNTDVRDVTVVRHPPGQRAEAALVARDAPGAAELEETTDVQDVTLVLGRDAGDA